MRWLTRLAWRFALLRAACGRYPTRPTPPWRAMFRNGERGERL